MELIRQMRYRDLKEYRDEIRRVGGFMPEFWPLVIAGAMGKQVWEYSDLRGPLNGDGGFAIVDRNGRVLHRHVVWMS